jgi:hypothetical protein
MTLILLIHNEIHFVWVVIILLIDDTELQNDREYYN